MSELIERMCRAATATGSGNPRYWDDSSFVMQEAWRLQMRAAILAMREPTEAMLAAHDRDDDLLGLERDPLKSWQRMIDAALE